MGVPTSSFTCMQKRFRQNIVIAACGKSFRWSRWYGKTVHHNQIELVSQRSSAIRFVVGSPLLFFCTRSLSFTDALPSRRLHPTASTVGGLLTAFVLLAFLQMFRCSIAIHCLCVPCSTCSRRGGSNGHGPLCILADDPGR